MRENEESWVCTGGVEGRLWWGHLSHRSEGHPGSVDFPYKWVMEREENQHDVVGMYHTHPDFGASPSLRDDATMHQWVSSFGKPLLCLIEGKNGLKAYLYYDDESDPIPCDSIKKFGQLVVCVLPPKKMYDKPAVVLNPGTEKVDVFDTDSWRVGPLVHNSDDLGENFPLDDFDEPNDFLYVDWDEAQYRDQ